MWLLGGLVAGAILALGTPARAALLVDDFESGAQTNRLGGTWYGFADAATTRTPAEGLALVAGEQSSSAGQFAFTFGAGTTYPYAGAGTYLAADGGSFDLSDFAGLGFVAKGSGSFVVQVMTTATQAEANHYSVAFTVGEDFTRVEVRFSAFAQTWGTLTPFDPTTAVGLAFTASGSAGASGELVIDELELLADGDFAFVDPNPIVAIPKLNQLGFLPTGPKRLTVTVTGDTAPVAFEVRGSDGMAVQTGVLSEPLDETAATGEHVVTGDFSQLSEPGSYVVVVDGSKSEPFVIGDDVYAPLYRDALRAFYLIRSGVAIDDRETGVAHAASHTNDAVLRSDGVTQIDLAGGWYNAGDFGKWSHMAALASAYMMWLEELRGRELDPIVLGVPESGNGVPELLMQARWGLEWLLRMQRADGAVIHKVDSEPNFAWGLPPDGDPNQRYASDVGTIDTADFAAVMTQADRAFRSFDAAFADTCEAAAGRAFAWLETQPPTGNVDPYYNDADDSGERRWALVERARTGDPALIERATAAVAAWNPAPAGWQDPSFLGMAGLARDPSVPAALAEAARAKVRSLAESIAALGEANGYGVSASTADYYWGSVEVALHRAAVLVFAADLDQSARFRDAALGQLDYVLGRNSLAQSFVTGHGERSTVHPYHWTAHPLGIVMPGWASGGPNAMATGADAPLIAVQQRGTPPAKCYVDQGDGTGSWASNEGQTTENAALVFVSGYFAVPTESISAGGAGAAGAPSDGEASTSGTSSGCSCATPTSDAARGPGWLAFALAAVSLWSRRRK